LIRAAEPLATAPAAGAAARALSGPGKLCSGLGITLADRGLDLTAGGALFVATDGGRPPRCAASPRVGVDYAGAWAARKLRFYVPGNGYVSGQPR
jgi:DNA-3-methyladenine glycosylase